jgi:hypothetical protein
MTTVTMNDVFERLVAIAGGTNGGARGANVLACDMIHQDELYTLQDGLAALLADVANACGPGQARRLKHEFPFAFEHR